MRMNNPREPNHSLNSDTMFRWEKEFKKKWTTQNETEDKLDFTPSIKRSTNKSIIRHLNIIVDFSASIEAMDFKPNNKLAIYDILEKFSEIFKRENPLSIISFTFYQARNSSFSTNISTLELIEGSGTFNLRNAVDFSLNNMHDTYNKEFIIITCSISNEGDGPINSKIGKLSFINLNAEVYFFKSLAYKNTETNSVNYIVPLNVKQFESALIGLSNPDSVNSRVPVSFIPVCFPELVSGSRICTCHLLEMESGWECVCGSLVCDLPSQCPICNIQLVSGLVLAQNAYFHSQVLFNRMEKVGICRSCESPGISECKECFSVFCSSCRGFVEESNRFCPFC